MSLFYRKWKASLSRRLLMTVALGMSAATVSLAETYRGHEAVSTFIDEVVAEHGFERSDLEKWLNAAEKKQSILDAMSRPAERTKEWHEYRKIFVTDSRTEKGIKFWQENAETLARAERELGVPAEVIVAIIGVETRYGYFKGRYRVIDALSTLGFDYPRRAKFFKKELTQFFLLAREQNKDPMTLMGSYAGAMGYGQFMPSSYRAYAIDFDDDDFTDIWNNPVDAIGSVANYMKRHGWRQGEAVVSRLRVDAKYDESLLGGSTKPRNTVAELKQGGLRPVLEKADDTKVSAFKFQGDKGAEFWAGFNNFYVITRYNTSRMYAMSVHQLSQALKAGYEKTL